MKFFVTVQKQNFFGKIKRDFFKEEKGMILLDYFGDCIVTKYQVGEKREQGYNYKRVEKEKW